MPEKGAVVMGMGVDEPGGQALSLPVDLVIARAGLAHLRDAAIGDADVTGLRRPAEAVVDQYVPDGQIIHSRAPPTTRSQRVWFEWPRQSSHRS